MTGGVTPLVRASRACPSPLCFFVLSAAVLNRAVPEDPFTVKSKKVMTGKTFHRKE